MKYLAGVAQLVERGCILNSDGGSSPTLPLHLQKINYEIRVCKFKDIRHIFEAYHYKGGHMGGGISLCFSLWDNYVLMGGAVLGKLRQDKKYSSEGLSIEIRRMACIESAPKNSESYFLGKIIWYLKKNTEIINVISYADQSVGHIGTIYKAANFSLIGKTAPSIHVFWRGVRYHPRSLTINRPYSYQMRAAVKTGEAIIRKGESKLIYSYVISRKENPLREETKNVQSNS
jgi:hypothetical protein